MKPESHLWPQPLHPPNSFVVYDLDTCDGFNRTLTSGSKSQVCGCKCRAAVNKQNRIFQSLNRSSCCFQYREKANTDVVKSPWSHWYALCGLVGAYVGSSVTVISSSSSMACLCHTGFASTGSVSRQKNTQTNSNHKRNASLFFKWVQLWW